MIPDAYRLALLALLAFRVTRLIGWDELTIRPRTWVCGMSDSTYDRLAKFAWEVQEQGGDPWDAAGPRPPATQRRFYLAKLIHCPWCAGWWVSLITATAWWLWPHATTLVAIPFALSALVGLLAKNLDP